MLEKGLIVHSLSGGIPTANKQHEGMEGVPAGILVHVSNSNLNNLERDLKKIRFRFVFKYDATSVQVTRVLMVKTMKKL